jgi:ferritin-like metal-binding protein YciE
VASFNSGNRLDTLEDLFMNQLMDLYDAEKRVTTALPRLAAAAHNPALKAVFQDHQRVTQMHLSRLEQVFRAAGYRPKGDTCEGMRGLIEEGQQAIEADGNPDVKDAALIAAAQRLEHYEIAGYGCARTFAQRLGKMDAARLLQESLDEIGATDKMLTRIAERSVNPSAQAT